MKKIIFTLIVISLMVLILASFGSCKRKTAEENIVENNTPLTENVLSEDILTEDVLTEESIFESNNKTGNLSTTESKTVEPEPDVIYDLQAKEVHFKFTPFTAKEVIHRYYFVLEAHFVEGDAKHRFYLKYVDYDGSPDKFIVKETLIENVEFVSDVAVEDLMGDYRTNEILEAPYAYINGEKYILTDVVAKGIHWNETRDIVTYTLFIEYIEGGVLCSKTVETDYIVTEESTSTGGPIG